MEEYGNYYQTVGGNEGDHCNYPTRLDVYGRGCQHNCNYCYARSLLDFRGLWNPHKPACADLNKVKRTIAAIEPGSVVRMGGMTDCFMPLERERRLAYETIKALNAQGVHQLIVTKSDLIADDDYLAILDPQLAHVQVTVTYTGEGDNPLGENAPPHPRAV